MIDSANFMSCQEALKICRLVFSIVNEKISVVSEYNAMGSASADKTAVYLKISSSSSALRNAMTIRFDSSGSQCHAHIIVACFATTVPSDSGAKRTARDAV